MTGLPAFAGLLCAPRWIAWRGEERNGRATKVPYSPHGRLAKSNTPATWGDHAAAQARAAQIVNGHGGGVGLMLGAAGDGLCLGGIDFDCCLDAAGGVAPWAAEIIERLGTYAEVSPSGGGVKAFFRFPEASLVALRAAMGSLHGRSWKRPGDDHPPAIELHLGNRFFAVTGQHLPTTPLHLAEVADDVLLWVITRAGPAFKEGAATAATAAQPALPAPDDDLLRRIDRERVFNPTLVRRWQGDTAGLADASRSGLAFALAGTLKRAGFEREAIAQALRICPHTAAWMREKGDAAGGRELARVLDRAGQDDAPTGVAPALPAAPALWRAAALPAEDAAIPPRPWIVPGYLMRGAVTMLSGAGGAGKSSLAVAWTTALAAGQGIGRFAPRQPEIVVTYNVEDDRDEQHRRYAAARIAHRVPREALASRIAVCGPEEIGTLFERDALTGRVAPTPAMAALGDLVRDVGASVLVVDPLAELHNAEENDNTAMRAVVAAFRQFAREAGIAVVVLHHHRKGQADPGTADAIRGAGSITAAVRVALTLSTMSQQEADALGVKPEERRAHFRVDGAKSNYAPLGDAEWWRLAPVEIPNGEHVAACRPWSPPSPMANLTTADRVGILAEIERGQPDGFRWQSDPRAGEGWAGSLLLRAGLTEGQAKAALRAWEREGVLTRGKAPTRARKQRECFEVAADKLAAMRSGVLAPSWEGDE